MDEGLLQASYLQSSSCFYFNAYQRSGWWFLLHLSVLPKDKMPNRLKGVRCNLENNVWLDHLVLLHLVPSKMQYVGGIFPLSSNNVMFWKSRSCFGHARAFEYLFDLVLLL
mgnify:CR=1 FL=1